MSLYEYYIRCELTIWISAAIWIWVRFNRIQNLADKLNISEVIRSINHMQESGRFILNAYIIILNFIVVSLDETKWIFQHSTKRLKFNLIEQKTSLN